MKLTNYKVEYENRGSQYADSTLRSMKKDVLIAHIRCLEHNFKVVSDINEYIRFQNIELLNKLDLPIKEQNKILEEIQNKWTRRGL